jgi:hypothetical protein
MINPTYKKAFFTSAPSAEAYLGDLKSDGTVPLTADWNVGAFDLTANNLTADPTLGAELITNFAGWTDVADWAYGSSVWHHDATGTTPLVSDWQPTATTKYKIVVVNAVTAAGSGCTLTVGGQSYTLTTSAASNTDTFYLTALSTAALTFVPATNFHGDVVSVSVKAETNGALTATTATITNGLTVNSGSINLPDGDSTNLAINFPDAPYKMGIYRDVSLGGGGGVFFGVMGDWEATKIYASANGISLPYTFFLGLVGDTQLSRTAAGLVGVNGQTITAGAGTGLTVNSTGHFTRQIYKVTVTYDGFAAAALTADHTIATLPAKTKIVGFYADTTVPFTGGGVTAAALTVGKSAGGVEYIATHDVLSGAVTKGLADADMGTELTRAAAIQGGAVVNWAATTPVSARLTTVTANTDQLTAGSCTFYIVTEIY